MKKITIIGGDNRLRLLKDNLEKSGYIVDSLGLYIDDKADIGTSQIIILPVPTTKDNTTVFTPLTKKNIPLSFIKENTNSQQLILSCNYSFEDKCFIDYGSLDSYALLNAVPTAEGAIKLAIENTDFTLWKSKALVIGYGRVGKVLADRLKAIGCVVTVTARKLADLSLAEALGFNYINTGCINLQQLDYDIIFNTVDVEVIEDTALNKCTAKLIIDLSTHGGLNLEVANSLGIKAFKAPGLPSIIAPKTAAEILNNTIANIIASYDNKR